MAGVFCRFLVRPEADFKGSQAYNSSFAVAGPVSKSRLESFWNRFGVVVLEPVCGRCAGPALAGHAIWKASGSIIVSGLYILMSKRFRQTNDWICAAMAGHGQPRFCLRRR